MSTLGITLFILVTGVLQAFGPPMNAALNKSIQNPWLASIISFALIVPVFLFMYAAQPKPFPNLATLSAMPWWAPFGGIVGAFAVFAGLMFVSKLGAGAVSGLLICANLVASLAVDHFGWFGVEPHPISIGRVVGGLLMVGGIVSISKF